MSTSVTSPRVRAFLHCSEGSVNCVLLRSTNPNHTRSGVHYTGHSSILFIHAACNTSVAPAVVLTSKYIHVTTSVLTDYRNMHDMRCVFCSSLCSHIQIDATFYFPHVRLSEATVQLYPVQFCPYLISCLPAALF